MFINKKDKSFILLIKESFVEVLLDEEDFDYFKEYSWCFSSGYAVRNRLKYEIYPTKTIKLHREVLLRRGIIIPKGKVVDHLNQNKLDNRFSNLRIVSPAINQQNVSEKTKKQRLIQIKNIHKLGLNIRKGNEHFKSKKIIDTKTNEVYDSIREASIKNNIPYAGLVSMLRGLYKNNTSLRYLEN